ncbi:putative glyoxalase superfamily protein PhnB [Saccharothrix ecbatanensis]|uniref:Putative glyoxalase superfamily protein PhnB n=1 Tax=Saccharothrix ecbatanensis TaxID=1105145 RepID=A0A7W9M4V1_9PSEU|nr:VOC family protein [Saccharothrix ecbatanensis]MBB5807445.1 putative glyoxalase superfamily protein PhnB [Saccharothrix ecbatanensis]
MTDPFEGLRLPDRAVDPDPGFAARLRERLEREVLIGGGDVRAVMETYGTVVPYLAVRDTRAAVEYYVEVFGAVRRGEEVVMPDGSVGHAEIAIGDSVLMLADESPEYGHIAPGRNGVQPMHRIEVPDVDGAVRKAVEEGGSLLRPAADTGHGYSGTVLDPFGYRWMVAAQTGAAQSGAPAGGTTGGEAQPKHGEVGYYTLTVPDDEAAKRFYGAVLGWRFPPGNAERGWGVEGAGLPMSGLWGGQRWAGWKLMYSVDDLASAMARVREQGGTAKEPERQPYGLSSECVDNQGVEFWLWQQ